MRFRQNFSLEHLRRWSVNANEETTFNSTSSGGKMAEWSKALVLGTHESTSLRAWVRIPLFSNLLLKSAWVRLLWSCQLFFSSTSHVGMLLHLLSHPRLP